MSHVCDAADRRRVVIFPLPYAGHTTPMLQLAAALHERGHAITVLHTELHAPDPGTYPADYRSVAVPAPNFPAGSYNMAAFLEAVNSCLATGFKDRLAGLVAEGNVRCVVTDVMLFSAQAAARELGVPVLTLVPGTAATFRGFMAYATLLDKGQLPDDESRWQALVEECPPLIVRGHQGMDRSSLHAFAGLAERLVDEVRRSSGLILNTVDVIEEAEVGNVHDGLSVPVFPIGPLNKISPPPPPLLPRHPCLEWLDTQSTGSVLFVSLGTAATMDAQELVELGWGLADTGHPFVWVVRPGMIHGCSPESEELPAELAEHIGERGMIVPWAPQAEVLRHAALAAFLTHNGWNSTVEALSEGVPMACLPCFGDQLRTARYVCEEWRVGVEVPQKIHRETVRSAIDSLMGPAGAQVRERALHLKDKIARCILQGGSSHSALLALLQKIASF